jgi:hypothetical protein
MDLRRRRILMTILVVVLAVVVGRSAAGALVSFPASLLIPLLLMVVATALFDIWAWELGPRPLCRAPKRRIRGAAGLGHIRSLWTCSGQ